MNDKLVEISNFYGKNGEYVLAGGGNTSLKEGGFLYVKGSGTTLATIDETGFVKMDLKKLNEIMEKTYSKDGKTREAEVLADLMAARVGDETKRPSVETSLHGIIPYRFVVHLHPALVNGLTCSKGGEKKAYELFGDDIIWVDICEPGYTLAILVKDKLEKFAKKTGKNCQIIILQNHGVFVGADSVEEIKEIYADIMGKLSAQVTEPDVADGEPVEGAEELAPVIRALTNGGTGAVRYIMNGEVAKVVKDEEGFAAIEGAYTPDHIVYCKAYALFVKNDGVDTAEKIKTAIAGYVEKFGYEPKVIAVQGVGVYVTGKNVTEAKTTRKLLLDMLKIAHYTQYFGGTSFMPERLVDFIVNWEVESYRSKKSQKANAGRVSDKVVIVTGSAQGFGQGIAEDMFKEGANVVIADLNFELADSVAKKLNEQKRANVAFAVKVDVTSEESVKAMIKETVLYFGGVDVFVNNAGIVRAGSIEEMALPAFELVTKVNYNAYFICVKYATHVMKIQHAYNPQQYFDVVQINSKSGLTGSNKNFAYAGSKFGGIGLTQSFALELIPYNIKVNSVCPGNFLDGPLWNDPVKGLFVQYFNAGKVPGAKSVADVRKYYESKVPAGRGCTTPDVVKAIYYCIEQVYETGQAIPVTGGQNMLN